MRVAPSIILTDEQKNELTRLSRSGRTSVRLAERSRIELLAAQGLQNKQIDRQTPKGKALHLIADNYATHKHPTVQAWLVKHPRFQIHFFTSLTVTSLRVDLHHQE